MTAPPVGGISAIAVSPAESGACGVGWLSPASMVVGHIVRATLPRIPPFASSRIASAASSSEYVRSTWGVS